MVKTSKSSPRLQRHPVRQPGKNWSQFSESPCRALNMSHLSSISLLSQNTYFLSFCLASKYQKLAVFCLQYQLSYNNFNCIWFPKSSSPLTVIFTENVSPVIAWAPFYSSYTVLSSLLALHLKIKVPNPSVNYSDAALIYAYQIHREVKLWP